MAIQTAASRRASSPSEDDVLLDSVPPRTLGSPPPTVGLAPHGSGAGEVADAEFYLLGPYRLDARARILLHGGDPVPLGERAVSVLLLLVEQAGRLVRKDHLVNVAWNGMAVEESNLSVQIAALRRVLDVVPGGWNWIETLPRRGYRFVGPVSVGAVSVGAVPGGAVPGEAVPGEAVSGAPVALPAAIAAASNDAISHAGAAVSINHRRLKVALAVVAAVVALAILVFSSPL